MTATVVEPETSTRNGNGRGVEGQFLPGNKCGRGTPLAGRVEKMRALLLQTCEKRIGEVLDILFDLAINEKQKWAIQEILDRSLGKVPDPRDGSPHAAMQVNFGTANVNLPDPPGGGVTCPDCWTSDVHV